MLKAKRSYRVLSRQGCLTCYYLSMSKGQVTQAIVYGTTQGTSSGHVFEVSNIFSNIYNTNIITKYTRPRTKASQLISLFPRLSIKASRTMHEHSRSANRYNQDDFVCKYFKGDVYRCNSNKGRRYIFIYLNLYVYLSREHK